MKSYAALLGCWAWMRSKRALHPVWPDAGSCLPVSLRFLRRTRTGIRKAPLWDRPDSNRRHMGLCPPQALAISELLSHITAGHGFPAGGLFLLSADGKLGEKSFGNWLIAMEGGAGVEPAASTCAHGVLSCKHLPPICAAPPRLRDGAAMKLFRGGGGRTRLLMVKGPISPAERACKKRLPGPRWDAAFMPRGSEATAMVHCF